MNEVYETTFHGAEKMFKEMSFHQALEKHSKKRLCGTGLEVRVCKGSLDSRVECWGYEVHYQI